MMEKLKLGALVCLIASTACSPDTVTTTLPTASRDQGSSSMPEATPSSFTIVPNEWVSGDPGTPSGNIFVATSASFDRFLHVTTDNPQELPFLASGVVVPAGGTATRLLIDPQPVSTPTVVTIFVTGNGVTVSATLTVNPPGTPPPEPTLSSYVVNPSTVNAGVTATGTVAVPSPAPSGGVVVSLSSRVPGSASVPSSVTVPAGATQVSFPISTFAGFPNSTTSVLVCATNVNTTICSSINVVTGGTATSSGTTLAAPSLLSPSADQRFPIGSNILFDWGDVAGAASYSIQIDDRDTFPAPLVASATTTASQFQTSTLPARTMWWRVRAIASDGTTGPWSSVRRFEVK